MSVHFKTLGAGLAAGLIALSLGTPAIAQGGGGGGHGGGGNSGGGTAGGFRGSINSGNSVFVPGGGMGHGPAGPRGFEGGLAGNRGASNGFAQGTPQNGSAGRLNGPDGYRRPNPSLNARGSRFNDRGYGLGDGDPYALYDQDEGCYRLIRTPAGYRRVDVCQ